MPPLKGGDLRTSYGRGDQSDAPDAGEQGADVDADGTTITSQHLKVALYTQIT